MKQTDRGIILSRISYSETSLILKIFTRSYGLKSFLFQGAKKKKGNVIVPFIPVEFTYYQRNDSQLAKLTELQADAEMQQLISNPIKSSLLYFQGEIIQKTVLESVKDEQLFDFLTEEIQWLNASQEVTNYPIYWILELTKHQGFYPFLATPTGRFFDLEEGIISNEKPLNHTVDESPTVGWIAQLIDREKTEILSLKFSKSERKSILLLLLKYYSFHHENFGQLKSLEIIEEIWA